ncbi:Transmembrane protein [Salix suchowensis]|nr:Transmembrane protein [Salix suchowensis]
MVSVPSLFLLRLSSLTILLVAGAQERAPHGLVYENPVAFSPSAVEFFHPRTPEVPKLESPCAAPSTSCSPLPLAARFEDSDQTKGRISTDRRGGGRLGAGGVAGVILGVAFAVLLTLGVYHVMITRKASINRAGSDQNEA